MVNFTLAINDYFKPKGESESRKVTEFINCSYWLNPAIAGRLLKGTIAEVNGRIYATAFAAKDGTAKASLNFHCNSIKVHATNRAQESKNLPEEDEKKQVQAASFSAAGVTEPMDDLPF